MIVMMSSGLRPGSDDDSPAPLLAGPASAEEGITTVPDDWSFVPWSSPPSPSMTVVEGGPPASSEPAPDPEPEPDPLFAVSGVFDPPDPPSPHENTRPSAPRAKRAITVFRMPGR